MRHAVLVTLTLLLAPALAARADAQSIPSPFRYLERAQSVSVFGGYLITDGGRFDLTPRSGPIAGLRYLGRFAGPVSGEVVVGAVPTDRTVYARTNVTDPTAPLTRITETDALLLTAEAGLRLSLTGPRTWHGLAPAVAATAGLVADVGGRADEEKALPANQLVPLGPAFAVGISAGTDWFLTERLSLRLLAKDHLWRREIPEGLTGARRSETEWTHNIGVTLGAAFHF